MPQMLKINALLLALAMALTVGGALGFEHIGGFIPCKLCLAQREPYYLAIPVALLAALAAGLKWPACAPRGLMAITGLLMLYAALLGAYHSGVEWGWWLGPQDCGVTSTSIQPNALDLLSTIDSVKAPSCDEAAGRFLGLSFAGWQFLAALPLALASLWVAKNAKL